MKRRMLTVAALLIAVSAGTPGRVQAQSLELYQAAYEHLRNGQKASARQEIIQVIPLSSSRDHEVCVFGDNDQNKGARFNYSLEAFLAQANGPVGPGTSIGGFNGSVRLSRQGGFALGQDCFQLMTENADYALVKVQFTLKSSRNVRNGTLARWGVFSVPLTNGSALSEGRSNALRRIGPVVLSAEEIRALRQ